MLLRLDTGASSEGEGARETGRGLDSRVFDRLDLIHRYVVFGFWVFVLVSCPSLLDCCSIEDR